MILHQRPFQCCIRHPITNKLYALNCWYYSVVYKKPVPNWLFSFPLPYKNARTPALTVPPFSRLNSCTPTKSNLHLANCLSEPDLFRHLMFHVPNHMSLFYCLGFTKGTGQALHKFELSLHENFWRWRFVSTSPKSQAEGPPLVGCPRLLIQYIRSLSTCWRSFFLPKLEEELCCGHRDPLMMVCNTSNKHDVIGLQNTMCKFISKKNVFEL